MTDNRKKDIRNRIKEIVKHIWVNEIHDDYNNDIFLCEDTLKNVLYFYLRQYMKSEIEFDNIRIYTEYCVEDLNLWADIAVVYLNENKIIEYTQQGAEPIAIFELKYKNRRDGRSSFLSDVNKVKNKYQMTNELSKCDYYLCFISEYEYDENFFVDKSHKKNYWITELTAIWNTKNKEDDPLDWSYH